MALIDDIKNILLRVTEEIDLTTKADLLDNTEVDNNFIEIYRALKALVARTNPEGDIDLRGAGIEFKSAIGDKKFRYLPVGDSIKIQFWDGANYQDIQEFDKNFQTRAQLPVVDNYACYTGGFYNNTVGAGVTQIIPVSEIIESGYFELDNNEITIKNLPAGYFAYIEVLAEIAIKKNRRSWRNCSPQYIS